MKICMVCPYFPSPKVPYHIEGIFRYKYARMLQLHGHDVFVITSRIAGIPSYEEMDGIKIFRVRSFNLPKIKYFIPNFQELMKNIMKAVKNYKIDVIEFNNYGYLTSLPIFLVKGLLKVPTTISVDGLNSITYFSGNKFVDFVGLLYTITIGKRMLEKADGIRLSHATLRKHLERMGVSSNKLRVIYNAVDLGVFHSGYNREFKRKELGVEMKDTVLLFVGRLDAVKGVGFLITAAKNLMRRYRDLKLILVGDGVLYEEYRKMAADFTNKIIFTGIRRDIAPLLNAADIVVLPSLSEGCPNVVLEAAATGIPVVATNVGAVPEIIVDGETGFIVLPRSSKDLEEALRTLIENPRKGKEMGRKAREFISKNFNMKIVGNRINGFYEEVVKNAHAQLS